MALIGVLSSPRMESIELRCFSLTNSPFRRNVLPLDRRKKFPIRLKKLGINTTCSLSSEALPTVDSGGKGNLTGSASLEDDLSHVTKFKMSDFKIRNRVSIGFGGRAGELVFEAVVKDPNSPLYKTRVVLRQHFSAQAKRRGRRAIEYHGSLSLRHWLQQSDWLSTLEATLALDEESVRRVGDDTVGGPAVSRQLRLIRILMRDLLIGVNYLHSHGLAHTELRLENLHISPVDKHLKVGILGNASDFYGSGLEDTTSSYGNMDRRNMMIAFDMRCVGFIMAKMVLRELMDPLNFAKFKAFLTKANNPSCLREFMLHAFSRDSSPGNLGIQILDRNSGAGWHLLSSLLATNPMERISCLNALRHPFLCGPKWRVNPSIELIRWSLGSTAVRITEEYIYAHQQRNRLAHFIELMEILNPHSKPKHWLEKLPGKWRLLYCTGRHIGLTLRQPSFRVLIGDVHLTISKSSKPKTTFSVSSHIGFRVVIGRDWPHDKSGVNGALQTGTSFTLRAGRRVYLTEETTTTTTKLPSSSTQDSQASVQKRLSSNQWRKVVPIKEFPSSLPVAKLISGDIEVAMSLDDPLVRNVEMAQKVVQEVRVQVPPEIFDPSKLVCGTYVDSRLLVLRSVNGSALLFTRSCTHEEL
ncbi:probable plastid-lipid-associated protein 14, chloroplastic isoform X2 [Ipomoea triloba]|uniref:probable plastid-lipid-associated protein 14, chloroplastic isoform X2 n=1 Tax=Ipomoea triloba TaxID=35885 RepID=UPI00125E8811|nr:probable plastid-lipid-associated protein 14, chloroplastic isoform X2 [Ipomoea triloba]